MLHYLILEIEKDPRLSCYQKKALKQVGAPLTTIGPSLEDVDNICRIFGIKKETILSSGLSSLYLIPGKFPKKYIFVNLWEKDAESNLVHFILAHLNETTACEPLPLYEEGEPEKIRELIDRLRKNDCGNGCRWVFMSVISDSNLSPEVQRYVYKDSASSQNTMISNHAHRHKHVTCNALVLADSLRNVLDMHFGAYRWA